MERDPFEIYTELINLHSGEIAYQSVKVYKAHAIGETLILEMRKASAFDHTFKRRNMPITMKTKSTINVGYYSAKVDIQLPFQRLITFIHPDEINDAFSYGLCTRPASLFDNKGLMNAAKKCEIKPALYDLYGLSGCILSDRLRDTNFVIEEGSLLHKISWTIGNIYADICETYIRYLLNNYGEAKNIFVVFDGGYLNPSTKDTTHLRRSNGKIGGKIFPVLTNPLIEKKNEFLLNNNNKQAILANAWE